MSATIRERERHREKHAWRAPHSLTCLFDIDPQQLEELRKELDAAGDQITRTPDLNLDAVKSLQFFRVQIFPDPEDEHGPRLLFNTVYDGPLHDHLDELLAHIGKWFGSLLSKYSQAKDTSNSALAELMLQHRVGENTLYLGFVLGSAEQIRQEHRLREMLGNFADQRIDVGKWGSNTSAESIRQELRAPVFGLNDDSLPSGPRPKSTLLARVCRLLDMTKGFLSPFSGLLYHGDVWNWLLPPDIPQPLWWRVIVKTLLPLHYVYTYVPTQIYLNYVERVESTEEFESVQVSPDEVEILLRREDHQTQNPLSACTVVRDSDARRSIVGRILRLGKDGSRHIWNYGRLAGIDTIHCARIMQIDGGRRLLFMSDYDGSWERYLIDFLTVGNFAVVPIFTNMRGCPPTRRLLQITPKFAPRFLAFTRRSQMPVQVWYSAWPDLSMKNLLSNRRLRDGLFVESMSEADAAVWLRELG